MTVEDVAGWNTGFEDLMARIVGRSARIEPRWRARAYLLGLLSPTTGKNGWTLAEAAGDRAPDGMQRLLNEAAWDADTVRDDVRGYVAEHLGDPDGVLVVDLCRPWNYADPRPVVGVGGLAVVGCARS